MDIFNSSNIDLIDDNFESIQFQNSDDYQKKIFNDYSKKNKLNLENFNDISIDNFININKNEELKIYDNQIKKYSSKIEAFSNNKSSCPLMSGDEVIIEHGTNEDEHLIDIDNKKFAKKRKYLTKFKINEGEKDKIIKYGDSISLTKSGKKKHKNHPYYVKYKQKNQIDINNNIVTAMKSPNLKLTYEFTVVTTIWQRERSNDWVRLIGKGNSNKRNYGLWVHPDGRSLSQIYGVNSGHNVWPNTPVIPLKKWTHLATTFKKNGEHKFYFNGNLFKSLPTTGTPFTDEEPLTLGGANFHTTFNGLIKDSYVFNKVLNDEEIKSLSSHSIGEKNFKIPTDSNHQKGDMVFYNDRVHLNNLGKILFTRPLGVPCSTKYPTKVTGIDGDYSIKEIKVRCDNFFEMYIDGVTYKGNGWNKTFTFNNPVIKNPKGYIIGFKCTNTGGPGGLIAQIEFQNGSFMVTDNTWQGCNNINNEKLFKTNPTNYYHGKDSWKRVNVIGLNQNNKMKWDGRKKPEWDRLFVDNNFSQFANYIWGGKCLASGSVYIKKSIGKMPLSESCSKNLTYGQALCYLERYPSIKKAAIEATSINYRYEFNKDKMSWYQHEQEAVKRGGHLVCTHNKEESDYINKTYLHKCGTFGHWIGAIRIRGPSTNRSAYSWKWVDGTPWNFENFLRNHTEPNNTRETRAHTWKVRKYGSWNDLSPNHGLPGVYQFKLPVDTKIDRLIEYAMKHWKNFGCKNEKSFQCLSPPATIGIYDYQGCYYDDYNERIIEGDNGTVKSLLECSKIAEKNKHRVFGVTDNGKCYSSNDIKNATKNDEANSCLTLGNPGKFQVYYKSTPFPPDKPKLSNKNFDNQSTINIKEKFENKEEPEFPEKPKLSIKNFSDKFTNKNNYKKYILIILILITLLFVIFINF